MTATLSQAVADRSWARIRGQAPGLAGLAGRMRLHVAESHAGVMHVEDSGEVWIIDEGDAETIIAFDSDELLLELLRGDLSPIVAHLQGRLRFQGDAALALRVLFGLQAGSPWSEPTTVS